MRPIQDASDQYQVERRALHAQRPGFRISEIQIGPAQKVPWHYHTNIQDTFYVIEGTIRLFLRDPKEEVRLGPGQSWCVAAGRPHLVANGGLASATFLVLQGIGDYDFVPLLRESPDSHGVKQEVVMGADSQRSGGVALGWPVWFGIVCEDLEQQRRFYRDVLGLPELKACANWVWFDFGGKLLELLAKAPLPQYEQRMVSFAFEVDDIRSARAELIGRGVEPVTDIEGGPESLQYWTYFKDAEGNLFELVQRIAMQDSSR